jgi:lipooligosaccharide transport system permease protein
MIVSYFSRALKVWRRHLDVFKSHYYATIVGNIGEPILYLLAFGLGIGAMIKEVNGLSYIEFLAPGMVAVTAMTAASFECSFGSYTRMAEQGVFHAMLATPLKIENIVLGEILWGATKSLFATIAMLIILALFGVFHEWAFAPIIMLNMFVLGLVFGSIALCVSAVSKSYESFNFFFTLFLTPMILFSGIYFPTDRMPGWLTGIFKMFPPHHAVILNRYLFYGTENSLSIFNIVSLVLFASAGIYIATKLVRRRLIPPH